MKKVFMLFLVLAPSVLAQYPSAGMPALPNPAVLQTASFNAACNTPYKVRSTGSVNATLPTIFAGCTMSFDSIGSGNMTISSASANILQCANAAASSITILPRQQVVLTSDGSSWYANCSNATAGASGVGGVVPVGIKADVQVAQTATWSTSQSGGTALTAVTTSDNDSFGYYANVGTAGVHTFSAALNSSLLYNVITQAFKGTGTVGTCWGTNDTAGGSTTITVSISPTGGAGHYVIAFARGSDNGGTVITGITFSDGSSYTNMLPSLINSGPQVAGSNTVSQGAYFANAAAGSRTLTATFSASAQFRSIYACEVSGLTGTDGPAQFTSVGTAPGNTKIGSAIQTSQANDFVFTGGTGGSTSLVLTPGVLDGTITVTTLSSDPVFVAADVGKEVFATSACDSLNGMQDCFDTLTMGVITAVGGAHTATVTSVPLAAASSTGSNFTGWLLWGAAGAADDTAALQTAYNKALTVPGATLFLPCGIMFISSPVFASTATGGLYNPNISGCGPAYGGTILVPTPLFNPNNSTTGLIVQYLNNNNINFGGTNIQNQYIWGIYSNFAVWGAGQDGTGISNTSPILYANQSKFQNVAITGWLWNASVKLPVLQGAALIVDTVDGWAAGTDGLLINGVGPTTLEQNHVENSFFGAQAINSTPAYIGFALDVSGPGTFGNSGNSFNNTFNPGRGIASFTCTSNLGASIFNSQWNSFGDQIGGMTVNGSNVILNGSKLSMLQSYGLCEIAGSSTTYVRAVNSQIEVLNLASSTIFDDGGGNYTCGGTLNNVPCVSNSTYYSIWDAHRASNTISGRVIGSLSTAGLSADPALVNGNVALTTNWGVGATVTLAKGSSFAGSFLITEAGSPGSGPVLTLTFPVPFAQTPSSCTIDQVAGNFTLSHPVTSSLSTTGVVFTWTGTPSNTDTYTFFYRCSQ